MRCPETNEMAAYLDGAVTNTERARWCAHFQQCHKCRKALEELRMLLALDPLDPGQECMTRGMALVGATRSMRSGQTTQQRAYPGIYN